MEISQTFGFLEMLRQSVNIILRNAKMVALITTVDLSLSSFLFLLFNFSYQFTSTYMTNSIIAATGAILVLQIIISFALMLVVAFTFMFSSVTIAYVSWIATVITAATSFTSDRQLSLHDLFSLVKTKWRSPFRFKRNSRKSKNLMPFLPIFAVSVALPVVLLYPNPITIAIVSCVGILMFGIYLYTSVVPTLSAVILVVEEGCEAEEEADKLVQGGQRVQGFMVNMVIHVLGIVVLLGLWVIMGHKWSLQVYLLLFINYASVSIIFLSGVYTVYYFRCKEYHGQEIQLLGNLHYTT